jgi:hypothetical protein
VAVCEFFGDGAHQPTTGEEAQERRRAGHSAWTTDLNIRVEVVWGVPCKRWPPPCRGSCLVWEGFMHCEYLWMEYFM